MIPLNRERKKNDTGFIN